MATVTLEPLIWSPIKKATFRFFTAFFLLYIFFNPNGVLPYTDTLFDYYIRPFHGLIPWLAKHVLHLAKPVTVFTNGSGDTTYDYVTLLFAAMVSVLAAITWSITGRNTKNYNKLFYWLTVILRYYVGITMVTYASFKVIQLQFPTPSLSRLIEPMGDMSPMGLAWNYIGYSAGFNLFTGLAELGAGVLLFFRKTTTLGAALALVVVGNVMAINYFYDVPVKLLATILEVMCIFLLMRDARRLVNFFFLNKDALPSNLSPHRFSTRWKNILLAIVKYALVAYVVLGDLYGAVQQAGQYGETAKKPPLYGLYEVTAFVRNRDTIPPLTTDTSRWGKLVISRYEGYGQVNYMNDSIKYVAVKVDTVKHKISINTQKDTLHKYTFSYAVSKPDILVLNGKWKLDSLRITMKRFDEKNFLLLKRGFHWVNEFPLNR
jgi:hypothetical protein